MLSNVHCRQPISGVPKASVHHYLSAFLFAGCIPAIICYKSGLLFLGQLLPYFLLFYLLQYLIHFNFLYNQPPADAWIYYSNDQQWEHGIRGRTSIALGIFLLLLLIKIPFSILTGGFLWSLFRFYNLSYFYRPERSSRLTHRLAIEWVLNFIGLVAICINSEWQSSSICFVTLATTELIKFLLHAAISGADFTFPILPSINFTIIKQNISDFTTRFNSFLVHKIILFPAVLLLPGLAVGQFYFSAIWMLAGIYMATLFTKHKVASRSFLSDDEINSISLKYTIHGSLIGLIWSLCGYVLLSFTKWQDVLHPAVMIPVYLSILLTIYNIPQEYLLLKYGEHKKIHRMNALLLPLQLCGSYLTLSSGNHLLTFWVILISLMLYSAGIRYFSRKQK